ncbi:hypothetical protein BV898_16655 [Hypsibius exemplaris]|uniref:Uncharacterized protein n=1 Tax=Hypsibius exemplaris TaxID=2072580 RepID=A0A9X6NKL1_HYPEX|nr:hypothetical protein BV898_16655 [Hypsibius exemplaris]
MKHTTPRVILTNQRLSSNRTPWNAVVDQLVDSLEKVRRSRQKPSRKNGGPGSTLQRDLDTNPEEENTALQGANKRMVRPTQEQKTVKPADKRKLKAPKSSLLDFEEVLDAIRAQRMWELKLTSRRELNLTAAVTVFFVRYVDTRDLRPGWKMAQIYPSRRGSSSNSQQESGGGVSDSRRDTQTRTTPELEILQVRQQYCKARRIWPLPKCTPAFSLTAIPQPSVTDVEMDIAFRRRHAQTVAERNTMTASPEELAEYDIEEED